MPRIAVLYEDAVRQDTTGIYCLRALQELQRDGHLQAVRHFRHAEVSALSPGEWDLLLCVDDGVHNLLAAAAPLRVWGAALSILANEITQVCG